MTIDALPAFDTARALNNLRGLRRHPTRRLLAGGLALLLVLALTLAASLTARTTAAHVNVLVNGGFEAGFQNQAGCGTVGSGWNCFTNDGTVNYGFFDDTWREVVAEGSHSQLIGMNTRGMMQGSPDRYAGLYQTVRVTPWQDYEFSLRGLIRTTEMEGDPWRYRVEIGWTQGWTADWRLVTNWRDVSWNTYYSHTEPGNFDSFSTRFRAESDAVTLYVRVWKKWGVGEMDLSVNIDDIRLTGPSPYATYPPYAPHVPATPYTPAYPQTPTTVTCGAGSLLANGNFESGFNRVGAGYVGKSWGYFTNDGQANYQFNDDTWPRLVAEGGHSQYIGIGTTNITNPDPDRYAGIYQRLTNLVPGATYQLSIIGLLRGQGGGDDPYRFMAQWGYMAGNDPDWTHVTRWQDVPAGPIYPRTDPGATTTYTTRFTAPAAEMVLFIRGWLKWATYDTVLDLNLDDIRVSGCSTPSVPPPPADTCVYAVQPGDTLGKIAGRYGLDVFVLAQANGITNLNLIYVGQRLQIPGCQGSGTAPPVTPVPTATPAPPAATTYVVRPGDTLSAIAARHGVDLYLLAEVNKITNLNIIYVGQVLTIPDP